MSNYKQELSNSTSIRQEIQRFEGVHPSIYAVYELLDSIEDIDLQNQIRDHIISVEDSFVNSQEWTLSKSVPEIRLGILGSISSGKSALVHRYLTGSYVREESPEGGRFKKEIVVDGQSNLLLVRDEGGPPEIQFSSWVDGIIFVFSLSDEASFHSIYNYYRRLVQYRNVSNVPLVLVGTQDSITPDNPRSIPGDRAKKLASDLKGCLYYETCATYGLNVDRVFHDVAQKISLMRRKLDFMSNNHVLGNSSHLQRSVSTSAFNEQSCTASPVNGHAKSLHGGESTSSLSLAGLLTPTPLRKSSRRKSNLFSTRKVTDSEEKRRFNEFGFGRNIPVKQGWLLKRTSKAKISNKEWKKKYVALEDDGKITYYSSMHDYRENIHKKSLAVVRTTIKVPSRHPSFRSSPASKSNNAEENLEFHLISMDGASWHFLSSCADERDEWVTAIERQIMLGLQNNSPYKRNTPSEKRLSEVAGNSACVDCGAVDPTWASLNLGCLMCIECSGIHRNLGTHLSRVRSLELDDLSPECAAVLEKVGNLTCNSIWEGALPQSRAKPMSSSSREERELFIRDKYEKKVFLTSLPAKFNADRSSSLCYAIADANYQLIMHMLAHITRDDLNKPVGPERQTPLHVASSIGDLAAVQLLLWLRANPTVRDAHGESPMSLAEQNCHKECYRLLTANKASYDSSDELLPQNCRDDVTNNDVSSRPHMNYMYTSAI
ncbi:unnamed protein product [Clavelina lepadiformis]|uniref:Uncharacterized protein n=1 Tax=Clavelina lepadiformis TaxID=159417 RepID=A0ABP0FT48_CLALP